MGKPRVESKKNTMLSRGGGKKVVWRKKTNCKTQHSKGKMFQEQRENNHRMNWQKKKVFTTGVGEKQGQTETMAKRGRQPPKETSLNGRGTQLEAKGR